MLCRCIRSQERDISEKGAELSVGYTAKILCVKERAKATATATATAPVADQHVVSFI